MSVAEALGMPRCDTRRRSVEVVNYAIFRSGIMMTSSKYCSEFSRTQI